jgi:hypothetical protein
MGKRNRKLTGVNAACAKFVVSEMFEGDADASTGGAKSERRATRGDDEGVEDALSLEKSCGDENHDLDAQLELERAFVDWIAPEEVLLETRFDPNASEPVGDDGYLDVDLFDIILNNSGDAPESICTVSTGQSGSSASQTNHAKKKPEKEMRATLDERRGSLEFHAWLESLNDFTSETKDKNSSLV